MINPSERKYPNVVSKGLIIGLSIILAVSLIPAMINFSLNQTLFKTDFYAGVLQKTNFYEQVPDLLYDTVISSGTSSLQSGYLAGLDKEQLKSLMLSLIPAGWVEAQTDAAMNSVLDFMNFKTDTLRIIIDLQPIKEYLAGPLGKQSVIGFLNSLPTCSFEQLTQIMITVQNGQGDFSLCNPPLSDLFNLDTLLDPVINSFSSSLPAVIILPPEGQTEIIDVIEKSPVFLVYRSVRSLLPFFPWICLVVSLMIFLLSIRSLHWLAGALGVPLVLAGLASAIPGVWLLQSGGQDFGSKFPSSGADTLLSLEGLVVEVFLKGMNTAGQGLLIWCLGALMLGVLLLVVWFVTKK